MHGNVDQREYKTRCYKLRMIGGPYDNYEVTRHEERAPQFWCWAGLPAEFQMWGGVSSFFEPALGVDPKPMERVARIEYQLEGVYDCGTYKIAIYSWVNPRVSRRYRVVEELR